MAYEDFDNINNMTVLFSEDYFESVKEINDIYNDVLIPSNIKSFLAFVMPSSLSFKENPEENYGDNLLISIIDLYHSYEKKQTKYGVLNGKEMTFGEYIHKWKIVYEEIEKWIQKNSSIPINLNL